jgi:hypothetical protein
MNALRLLVLLLATTLARTALADGGEVLSTSTLLDNGDTAVKIDIVFMGDGYTADQQDAFNAKVDLAVREFLGAHPLLALNSAFNIHRINVSSPESGTDKFSVCDGEPTGDTDQVRRTAMDSGYCAGGSGAVYRCLLTSDTSLALAFAANAPDDDIVLVLVNDTSHGGCRLGDLAFSSVKESFQQTTVHELGHAIFDLADEYQYDREDAYTGSEPGQANVTTSMNRRALKWADLLLPDTSVPTQLHGAECSVPDLPGRALPEDVIGTFEGAQYRRCGLFRPEYSCRMRESHRAFCAVCRREIVRRLANKLSADQVVRFTELHVKDDHDPWPRGNGEIYFNYDLRSRETTISGRWPASNESSFDEGDTKALNVYAGLLPEPAPATTSSIAVRMRESDWPDGDDDLSSDADEALPAGGVFTIDKSDYRLSGDVTTGDLRTMFDTLHIKQDQDPWPAGDGDIYMKYTVSNGAFTVHGRWPSGDGTVGISDGDTRQIAQLAAALARPAAGVPLTVTIEVWDEDGWLTFGDDELGTATFTFDGNTDFGANQVVHQRDHSNFRLTASVAGRLAPVLERGTE